MAVIEIDGQPWTRKHDDPSVPVVPSATRTLYPQSLEDLIQICAGRSKYRRPGEGIHAAGSHWALSEAAISDAVFVETHDPENIYPAMNRTLYDVVWRCLNPAFIDELRGKTLPKFDASNATEDRGLYPVHIESGKRIYELYAQLDQGDNDPQSLATHLSNSNKSYLGPLAFPTLGGAGGQTVFGALTTGTHGGDFKIPPLADAVLALHLVADGGKHYWIEPTTVPGFTNPLTDFNLLHKLYGQSQFGGQQNFETHRDDQLFNSVLVSVGRFGIVYSIVIATVSQYCLHQERRLTNPDGSLMTWQAIKPQINDLNSPLYTTPSEQAGKNRFLQIAVCVTPHLDFSSNLVAVTKHWNVPLAGNAINPTTHSPAGRDERGGQMAGNSHPYSPSESKPGTPATPDFKERACANANFLDGVLVDVIKEIGDFVHSNGTVIGAVIAVCVVTGLGFTLLLLLPALAAILAILLAFLARFRNSGQSRLGQALNDLRRMLLDQKDPAVRLAGLFAWHMIAYLVFRSEQKDHDFEAISYAVLDQHDYLDQSCAVNADSIEVFFDAEDPILLAYVDALLAFETYQEVNFGRAFVGYISLRFTGQTRALIGPQQFKPVSCAIEVSGLKDESGVTELLDFATNFALNTNMKGILHWGQRNESQRADIEERFGDSFADQTGPLHTWRQALSDITQGGKLNGFSSAFTRQTGLEVVKHLD